MKLLLCGLYGVTSAASDCWSPSMPRLAGCSLCTADELQGSQCVRSGRWFTCYKSVEECCKNGEVLNHVSPETCVAEAGKGDGSQQGGTDDPVKWEESDCQQVVTKSEMSTNRQCMEDCSILLKNEVRPTDDEKWSQSCMPAHWHAEKGRTVPDGSCFQTWVYGYSEPNELASYKLKLEAETPALCQSLCQEDAECVNWLWVSPLYAPGTEVAKRCMLKSEKMVQKALSIITETQPPTHLDVDFCNYEMGYSCQNLYKCLPCEGSRRCVWESHMHISGWKYCNHQHSCNIKPTSTPETATPSDATHRSDSTSFSRLSLNTGNNKSAATTNVASTMESRETNGNDTDEISLGTFLDTQTKSAVVPELSLSSFSVTSVTTIATSTLLPAEETTVLTSQENLGSLQSTSNLYPSQKASTSHLTGSRGTVETAEELTPSDAGTLTSFTSYTTQRGEQWSMTRAPGGQDQLPTMRPLTSEGVAMSSSVSHYLSDISDDGDDSVSISLVGQSSTGTNINLEPDTTSTKTMCPPSGCVNCSCCGARECECCQQPGIVLKIHDKPALLQLEVRN